jgi:ankyrin repeat protein
MKVYGLDDFDLYDLTEDNVKTYIIENKKINIQELEEYDRPNVLTTACMIGDDDVVRDCIEAGMDVTNPKLLEHASYYGFYEIVKMLLENGADPTHNGCISLLVSKSRCHYKTHELIKTHLRRYKLKNLMK